MFQAQGEIAKQYSEQMSSNETRKLTAENTKTSFDTGVFNLNHMKDGKIEINVLTPTQ